VVFEGRHMGDLMHDGRRGCDAAWG
jgi:hypothetical protein